MKRAILREVSAGIARCELTHRARDPIDVAVARRQHAAYADALRGLGLDVTVLPAPAELPDAVFVEDTACLLPEGDVLLRPGVASRQPEVAAVAAALDPARPRRTLDAPATLDGGDVLVVGREIFVGRSARTNAAGLAAFADIVDAWGYRVTPVDLDGCLHLKSAVTLVGPRTAVYNPAWVDAAPFGALDLVAVDPAEPWAGNMLLVGTTVVHAADHRRTAARVAAHGARMLPVPAAELAKAEGGVTCCCLLVP